MPKNPPLFPTSSSDDSATLRDLFATNLFSSAINLVGKMKTEELNALAAAVGDPVTAAGPYNFNFHKLFSYQAYQLADAMLEVREMSETIPEALNPLEYE